MKICFKGFKNTVINRVLYGSVRIYLEFYILFNLEENVGYSRIFNMF